MKNKRIPISAAKEISAKYEFPEVVIFAYDPETGNQHVTTYGKTKDHCIDAAKAGNHLKRSLGWPEEGNVPQADSVQPLLAEVLTELLHDAMSLLMNYEQRCEIDWIEDYEELIAKYNEHFS